MVGNLIACGGTFDHFHKGHEEFLSRALSAGKKLIVGLTSDKYVEGSKINTALQDQNSNLIETYVSRRKSLEKFLSQKKAQDRASILRIDNLFGPTLSKELPIDTIVVSEESKKGADIINRKREKLNLVPLKVLVAPPVKAEDGELISSERIRNGEINREGRLYIRRLWLEKDLILPENLKKELRKPFGEIVEKVKQNNNSLRVIAVGDETSRRLNSNFINQNISVVDFRIARKKIFSSFSDLRFSGDETVVVASNPAGHITHDLFLKVLEIIRLPDRRIILKIEGEEDLAVLPLILAAPLNTVIYYGQPSLCSSNLERQTGAVKVIVSEENKERAYDLVSKFRPI